MKIPTLFTTHSRFLNAFNKKESHLKNAADHSVKHNYWDQECLEHPTNYSCLIYCD